MLCRRCQARYDIGAWYLLPGSLRVLCPVGGLGRAPFWHVFVPATLLGCNSNCCTSACAGQQCLGKAACWVGVGSQVRFVTAGTSHGFTARRAAEGESSRRREQGQRCMVLSRRHQCPTWFCLAIANSCHRCE